MRSGSGSSSCRARRACFRRAKEKTSTGVSQFSAVAILLGAAASFTTVSALSPATSLLGSTPPTDTFSASVPGGVLHQDTVEVDLTHALPVIQRKEGLEQRHGGAGVVVVVDRRDPYSLQAEEGGIENTSLSGGTTRRGGSTGDLEVMPSTSPEERRALDEAVTVSIAPEGSKSTAASLVGDSENAGGDGDVSGSPEFSSIQAIKLPFIQRKEEWRMPGHGISLDAKGEPKSGTTWLGRLIPQLALQLCRSPDNPWCEMGGLVVTPNDPAPRYEFEMLKKGSGDGDSPTLFLHFEGSGKHYIPGMHSKEVNETCRNGGREHRNFFDERTPCLSEETPTRASLTSCLWDTSQACRQYMPSLDPAVRRTVVIVRDPRDVVLSERKMRIEYFHIKSIEGMSKEDFIRRRFEALVSWTHQRWVWHTATAMNSSSLVVVYENLQERPDSLIDLAAFMGLHCSEESALEVWRSHQNSAPHASYKTHGLERATVEWMNATMARLLPVPLALRWGITPTEV